MTQPALRRPLIAFTVEPAADSEDPRYEVQCETYGLEMTIDDEWPVDTVLLARSDLVDVVTSHDDLLSRGTIYAGVISPMNDAELQQAIAAGATWVCLDSDNPRIEQQMQLVAPTTLKVILLASRAVRIGAALKSARLPADRLVLALHPVPYDSAEVIREQARRIREKLHPAYQETVRILMIGNTEDQVFIYFAIQPELDGLFFPRSGYSQVVRKIQLLVLNM